MSSINKRLIEDLDRKPRRKSKYIPPDELVDEGYLQEVNRQFFHPLGLALSVNDKGDINVLDNRDTKEGMHFKEGVMDFIKYVNVRSLQELRGNIRQEKLGYRIQPVPRRRS